MKTKINNKTRIAWIDNAKAIAMFAVVLGHTSGQFYTEATELNRIIVSFNMYLFVMISAFCAYKSISKIKTWSDLLNWYKKISLTIGLPSVAFGMLNRTLMSLSKINGSLNFGYKTFIFSTSILAILLIAVWWLYRKNESNCINTFAIIVLFMNFFIPGICTLWFFPMLLEVSMIFAFFALLFRNSNNYIRYSSLILFLPFVFLISTSINSMILEFTFVYITGLLLAKYKMFEKRNLYTSILSIIVVPAVFILLIKYKVTVNFYGYPLTSLILAGDLYSGILRQGVAILLCCAITMIIRTLSHRYNFISHSGRLTLGIYPIHGFILHYISLFGPFTLTAVFTYTIIISLCIYFVSAYLYSVFDERNMIAAIFKGKALL